MTPNTKAILVSVGAGVSGIILGMLGAKAAYAVADAIRNTKRSRRKACLKEIEWTEEKRLKYATMEVEFTMELDRLTKERANAALNESNAPEAIEKIDRQIAAIKANLEDICKIVAWEDARLTPYQMELGITNQEREIIAKKVAEAHACNL